MEIANRSLLPFLCLLACSAPRRRCSAPTSPWRASPATSCFALAPTRRSRPPPPLLAHALELSNPCHAAVAHHAAATSPPPWRAQLRGPALNLLCARAPQKPQQAFPLTLSPFPRSDASERHRRSTPNAGELKPASTRHSRVAPPTPTPPTAPPHPRAPSRPLLVDQFPQE